MKGGIYMHYNRIFYKVYNLYTLEASDWIANELILLNTLWKFYCKQRHRFITFVTDNDVIRAITTNLDDPDPSHFLYVIDNYGNPLHPDAFHPIYFDEETKTYKRKLNYEKYSEGKF